MARSKFDEQEGSIARNFESLDPALRRTYYRNLKKHEADRRAFEAWAGNGFASGYEVIGGER